MRLVTLAFFLAVLLPAGVSFAQEAPTPESSVMTTSRPYLDLLTEESEETVVLSQGDPRWSWFRIGVGTVRDRGCLVMAIAMVALEHGIITDPLSMLRSFVMHNMFTQSGALYTSAIGRVLPGFAVVTRTALTAAHFDRVAGYLADGHDVLLKLDRDLRRPGIQQHWVRAIRSAAGDLVVADPNGGRIGTLTDIYGTTAVVREMLVLGRS